MFNIFLYLFRILACCVHVIPSAPEFPVSIFILSFWKFFVDHLAALPIEIPHETGDYYFKRYLYQHVHMIGAYLSYALNDLRRSFLNDLPLLLRTVATPHSHYSKEGFSSFIIRASLLLNRSPSLWFSLYKHRREGCEPLSPVFSFEKPLPTAA